MRKSFQSMESKRNASLQQKAVLWKQRGELFLSTERLKKGASSGVVKTIPQISNFPNIIKEVKDLTIQYAERQAFQESLHQDGKKLRFFDSMISPRTVFLTLPQLQASRRRKSIQKPHITIKTMHSFNPSISKPKYPP